MQKNPQESYRWFLKSANTGLAFAQNKIGLFNQNGFGVTQNAKEAARWYKEAADQGYDEAQFNLGKLFVQGNGVPKDASEAVRWYRKASDQGHTLAQRYLGVCYSSGLGVAKNPVEGVRWSLKAAEKGCIHSQTNLGITYERDLKNPQRAIFWYRRAANQGGALAQLNLSEKYTAGEGIPKNLVFAYKWLLLAKSKAQDIYLLQGNDLASRLKSLEDRLSPSQIEEGQHLAAAFSPVLENSPERRPSAMESEGVENRRNEARERNDPKAQPPGALKTQTSFGTGFVISRSGAIVTAAHVVTNAKTMRARLATGRMVPLRIVKVDQDLDLALLEADFSGYSVPPPLPINGSRNLTLGQSVMTIGFPNPEVQGLEPKYTQGTISALTGLGDDPQTLQISVPIQPGNSGGALMDMAGRVVGVVVSRLNAMKMAKETGALSENVNYAVKGTQLQLFLDRLPEALNLPLPSDETPPSNPEPNTIQKIKEATVFIIVNHR